MDKSSIRLRMRTLRDALPPEQAEADSRAAVRRMLELPCLQFAAVNNRFVSLYHPMRSELDPTSAIAELARRGAHILLPAVLPDPDDTSSLTMGEVPPELALRCDTACADLVAWLDPGAFGLLEPSHGSLVSIDVLRRELACVVVPGLAFDPRGYRCGWGKGYYDGFLARLHGSVPVVALAFDCQIMEELLPAEPHDVPVDVIVTPTRTVRPTR